MSDDLSPYVRVYAVINQNNHDNPTRLARIATFTPDLDTAQKHAQAIIKIHSLAGHPLPNLAATQTTGIIPLPTDLLTLITHLTDPGPCTHDDHGHCQTHGWLTDQSRCPHARAQQLLAAARTERLLTDD